MKHVQEAKIYWKLDAGYLWLVVGKLRVHRTKYAF